MTYVRQEFAVKTMKARWKHCGGKCEGAGERHYGIERGHRRGDVLPIADIGEAAAE